MTINWRTAFLEQAASDYRMFKRCWKSKEIENCHAAHYLQMASEKLAKSLSTTGKTQPYPDHYALTKFIRLAKQNPAIRKRWSNNETRFFKTINGLGGLAKSIEELVPTKESNSPNPEYPWDAGLDHLSIPCHYQFDLLKPSPILVKFFQFLELHFDEQGLDVSV